MPAAVYVGERKVKVEQIPVPAPSPGEVVVEVAYCGICGTDLHMVMDGWGRPGTVYGHELSGTVVAVGDGVDGLRPGDRVAGAPGPGCGSCTPCADGRPNLCRARHDHAGPDAPGAFARFKLLSAGCAYPLPQGLDLRAAALVEPLAVALHGAARAGARPGDRALVTGAGPIGVLTAVALVGAGCEVTVSEPAEGRRALAARLGVDAVTPEDLERPSPATSLAERPYRLAVECSGSAEAAEAALGVLDRGGTLVLAGTGMRKPRLDSNRVILHELSVTGTVDSTPDDVRAALSMLASGGVPVAAVVEPDDCRLDEVQRAMEQLSSGLLAGKVMVAPGG
jgi:(R,R)-butanediol dehydrogenase/meso-butanediol dehydrogenase/diacetyl reductase